MSAIASALRRLERRRSQAPDLLAPAVDALDAALSAFDTARHALDEALRIAGDNPGELEQVEERLFSLRAASRKFGVAVEALPALKDKIGDDLSRLEAGESRLVRLRDAVATAAAAYDGAAKVLSAARRLAAGEIERAVNIELPPLKLETAEFIVKLQTDAAAGTSEGIDQVEFWVKTNPRYASRAADEGRIRRRIGALHVGAQSRPGRSWLGAHARLR